MRTFAMTALCLSAALAAACGESPDQPDAFVVKVPDAPPPDSQPPPPPPDARVTSPPDALPDAEPDAPPPPIGECDPVSQIGCDPGEKCSYLIENEDPFLARTTCVPDGTAAAGAACIMGAPGPTTGYDNCQAGFYCINDTCTEVCQLSPDTCMAGSCTPYRQLFQDLDMPLGTPTVGVCSPACNLLDTTTCPDGYGCYLALPSGSAVCAPIFEPDTAGAQNEPCETVNNCLPGFQCLIPSDEDLLCAAWCDPLADGLTADGINRCRDLPQIASGDPQCIATGLSDNSGDALYICADCATFNCPP